MIIVIVCRECFYFNFVFGAIFLRYSKYYYILDLAACALALCPSTYFAGLSEDLRRLFIDHSFPEGDFPEI